MLNYKVNLKRLSSGHYYLKGGGPCEWAQVKNWPCTEQELRDGSFPEASETFIRACLRLAELFLPLDDFHHLERDETWEPKFNV